MKVECIKASLMLKPSQKRNVHKNLTFKNQINSPANNENLALSNNQKVTIGIVACGIMLASALLVKALKGKSSPKVNSLANDTINIIKSDFKNRMKEFPEDFKYIKNLAANLNIKPGDEFKLNSIIGASELKKLLNEFTPEDFNIGKNLEGAKNMTFRVNLHNHTNFSDGKMTVEEFLDQARRYADRIAENIPKDSKPPFIIAITDHDTMDGCKEALKIISRTPEKYKNLKIVLGSEISVSNNDPKLLSRPLNFELIGYCQNPYDKNLGEILNDIQKNRQQNVQIMLDEIQKHYPDCKFDINEAKTFHSNLRTMRTNGVLYLAGDYAKFKIALNEYIKQINKILPKDKEKLSAEKLFTQFGENYYYRMDAFGEKDIKEYFKNHGFKEFLEKNNILSNENENLMKNIFNTDLTAKENFIDEIVQKKLPTLYDRKNYTISPEKIFDGTTEGFYGFAHPAIIDFASDNISKERQKICIEKGLTPHENLVYEIFMSLKNAGKEKFYASEINYQSYPANSNPEWISFMKEKIADNKDLNLKYTGGIDAHKKSIFLKHKYLDEKTLSELLGENK